MKVKNSFILLIISVITSIFAFAQKNGKNTTDGQPSEMDKKSFYYQCPPCNLPCDTMHFTAYGLCPVCGMKLFVTYRGFENKTGEHNDICNKKVAVLIFPGVEIIDFSGPWEVFGAAGMEVFSVWKDSANVQTSMGLKLKPDFTFENAPKADILLIPGGNVNHRDTVVVNWIKKASKISERTMSVCTGAFYLGAAGLLDSLQVTTNLPAVPNLRALVPTAKVYDDVRFVDNGRIITSSGLSSGIDAAFHLVSRYIGKAQTQKLANILEYGWDENHSFIRGKLAEKYVEEVINVMTPFDYYLDKYEGNEKAWEISLKVKSQLTVNELGNLIAKQLEESSGWKKSKKPFSWKLQVNFKIWLSRLNIDRIDADNLIINFKAWSF